MFSGFYTKFPNLSCSPRKCLTTACAILTLNLSFRCTMSITGSDCLHWFSWCACTPFTVLTRPVKNWGADSAFFAVVELNPAIKFFQVLQVVHKIKRGEPIARQPDKFLGVEYGRMTNSFLT